MKTRINLGTFEKETAQIIRNELKRVKTFRNDKVETEFKSRTYGNRALNPHDGTVKINDAKKVAVYLNIEAENHYGDNTIEICPEQKEEMKKNIKNLIKKNHWLLDYFLSNGFKGVNSLSNQELFSELLGCVGLSIQHREGNHE